MPNTCCLPSCDPPRTRRIRLFGQELEVKNTLCSPGGAPPRPLPPDVRLQLSICPTAFCPAACPFCIAAPTNGPARIDPERLRAVLLRLKEEGIVRGVSITGGEPFYDLPLLKETLCLVFETLGEHCEVSLNTNGMGLDRLGELPYLSYIDAIHISRHHDEDAVNRRLFGGYPVPDAAALEAAIRSVTFPDIFVLNCMLLREGIHTPDDAHRYLDFAIGLGAKKVSFITATPINAYAAAQQVDYRDVLRADDPALLFTRGYRDYDICRCQDGVYASDRGGVIEFYGRSTQPGGCNYCRGLVYSADNRLRAGFTGPILL